MMGPTGFDRAKSNRVDSRVGDDPKSSKTIDANTSKTEEVYTFTWDVKVANDSVYAVAA
jgi:hypothetical protein